MELKEEPFSYLVIPVYPYRDPNSLETEQKIREEQSLQNLFPLYLYQALTL